MCSPATRQDRGGARFHGQGLHLHVHSHPGAESPSENNQTSSTSCMCLTRRTTREAFAPSPPPPQTLCLPCQDLDQDTFSWWGWNSVRWLAVINNSLTAKSVLWPWWCPSFSSKVDLATTDAAPLDIAAHDSALACVTLNTQGELCHSEACGESPGKSWPSS